MNQPLAESLTQLRVGDQSLLLTFYQQHRNHFARWARQHHNLQSPAAHELLREVLLDFYDQVVDGRITRLPLDLRAYIYGMARQQVSTTFVIQQAQVLPKAEAQRRQKLLQAFMQLSADSQQVLLFFYYRGYNFVTMAGKMGYANANVARIQKNNCLRKLYELLSRSDAVASV
ncbi:MULTISPECIES: RNA polymerase sigma factor [Hymenobacter]|uniref:Sigma-70 family RNA polymerase sigma factor n=1 Tax=Hymenobacter jejuensis TaxID=2502781 RepID=A0A5B8A082_9BACT|nr:MULTISPECIES: hypothetical protein [Hymenobacter]MBC6991824.1 hypothetical protein [Hymenobacter sp. BT491]QDA60143.1 hypothetical protein FHG12_08485 [Hymenobacter jejuensis]